MRRLHYKDILIQKYQKKYVSSRTKKLNASKTPFTWRLIKSEHEVNCFVGLVTILLFNGLLKVDPYAKVMVYWYVTKK